jgi:UDP-galactopyranose mutase
MKAPYTIPRFLIIGAGFSGAVIAHELAKSMECELDIWEEKLHVAGNCYTSRDEETGIMVHRYGPHIFNTDKKEIWDYINQFIQIKPIIHRVKAVANGDVYSLPINLHTINQFFKKTFSPEEAKVFLQSQAEAIKDPKSFEEQALSLIGRDLYKAFFYGYTKKQWGCEPSELPASILKRLPVRFNYNDNYYNNEFSGIPIEGYTPFVEKLLNHKNVHVALNRKFDPSDDISNYNHVFYTGPIDAFFNYKHGRLGYRTVLFEPFVKEGDYQGTSVINYCDEKVPFTRITEHKHFTPWENHEKTICFKEFSKETSGSDLPFYPKRLAKDKTLLYKYREEANSLKNISFLGRLATYRYMDMHHVISEAINFSKIVTSAFSSNKMIPAFPNEEK